LLEGAVGLIAGTETLDREILTTATELRAIVRCGVGVDNVDHEAAAERDIAIRSTPEPPAEAVAELTLAGILGLLRHLPTADRAMHQGEWHKPMGNLLRGRTVGLVGLGRVGKRLVAPKGGVTLLDRERLAKLKPEAILVNTARGGLVDEAALYDLLVAGKLAGAFLDVFAEEPYQGPLSELPQVLLSPHIGSYAAETRVRMETEAVEQLLAALAGNGD
jgi:D-3-phosphoglycerate dehydrogenase